MNVENIRRIAVVGAGLMGHGIAQEFALAGYDVRLHDRNDELLQIALGDIRGNLARLASPLGLTPERIDDALARITASPELDEVVKDADLVVEAIYEDLPAKHQLLRSLERLCRPEAILASNTSSFMPSRLAEALSCPERLLVTHYFNPPYLIPLVEIVPSPRTAKENVEAVIQLLERIGKKPVLLHREATGFVANRLQLALYREALAIVEQGIAEPEAVDQVVRYGFGRRLAVAGPIEVFDLAGLDTILAVAGQILPSVAEVAASGPIVPESLRQNVAHGRLGVKSGQGFHTWTPENAEELRRRLTLALVRAASHP
ncbi:MAG: 3-hydroxyacyl-CoA dehydrogenase family protein [Isosphaeraceae bacterium]